MCKSTTNRRQIIERSTLTNEQLLMIDFDYPKSKGKRNREPSFIFKINALFIIQKTYLFTFLVYMLIFAVIEIKLSAYNIKKNLENTQLLACNLTKYLKF